MLAKCKGDTTGECEYAAFQVFKLGQRERALPHLQISCEERKDRRSCGSLAEYYETGTIVPQDPAKARELHELACSKNYGPSCASLGIMVLDGLGGPVDFQRGAQLVKSGCHGAEGEAVGRACLRYAEMSLDGRLPLNEKDGHHYAMGGCLQGVGKACALAGKLLSEGRGVPNANPIDGAGLIKRGCELGDAQACIDYSHTGQGWIEQNRAATP